MTSGFGDRGDEAGAGTHVTVPVIDLSGDARVGGVRFGELLHAVLATVSLHADRETLAATVEVQARILSAPDAEVHAAVTAAERVLRHPLLQRARDAEARGRCWRETPVGMTLPDGTLVEGIVDLAFEENGRWVVVDFKTDRELSAQLGPYARQVQFYSDAIGTATGLPADPMLVRV